MLVTGLHKAWASHCFSLGEAPIGNSAVFALPHRCLESRALYSLPFWEVLSMELLLYCSTVHPHSHSPECKWFGHVINEQSLSFEMEQILNHANLWKIIITRAVQLVLGSFVCKIFTKFRSLIASNSYSIHVLIHTKPKVSPPLAWPLRSKTKKKFRSESLLRVHRVGVEYTWVLRQQ